MYDGCPLLTLGHPPCAPVHSIIMRSQGETGMGGGEAEEGKMKEEEIEEEEGKEERKGWKKTCGKGGR